MRPSAQAAEAAQPSYSDQTQLPDDFLTFPSPYLKAMLMRLRIEMFSVAKALQGELLDEFWRSIDELNRLRPAK